MQNQVIFNFLSNQQSLITVGDQRNKNHEMTFIQTLGNSLQQNKKVVSEDTGYLELSKNNSLKMESEDKNSEYLRNENSEIITTN